MAARIRECLSFLRWREVDLADASGCNIADVRAWLNGRERPALAVVAWLEALVKAHRAVRRFTATESSASASEVQAQVEPITRRNSMEHNVFNEPVTIVVGLGFPTKIDTVKEAYAVLNEWPPSKRNPAHAVALMACKAALLGEIEAETARGTFVAFAKRHDLLAPEIDGSIAARMIGDHLGPTRATGGIDERRPVS
jgi:hypothetical protein